VQFANVVVQFEFGAESQLCSIAHKNVYQPAAALVNASRVESGEVVHENCGHNLLQHKWSHKEQRKLGHFVTHYE